MNGIEVGYWKHGGIEMKKNSDVKYKMYRWMVGIGRWVLFALVAFVFLFAV